MKRTTTILTTLRLVLATGMVQTQQVRPGTGAAGSWRLPGMVQARFTADHDKIIITGPYS